MGGERAHECLHVAAVTCGGSRGTPVSPPTLPLFPASRLLLLICPSSSWFYKFRPSSIGPQPGVLKSRSVPRHLCGMQILRTSAEDLLMLVRIGLSGVTPASQRFVLNAHAHQTWRGSSPIRAGAGAVAMLRCSSQRPLFRHTDDLRSRRFLISCSSWPGCRFMKRNRLSW